MSGTVQADATVASGGEITLAQLARGINEDMVRNGFWPENKSDRNYGEAIVLIIGELCVEGWDAIDRDIPLESKDSIVEEIADAAIRHLDLMAGLGIEEEFSRAVTARVNGGTGVKDMTLTELASPILSADPFDGGFAEIVDSFWAVMVERGYHSFCSRLIYYPLLASVEHFRKNGDIRSDEMIAMHASAFVCIFVLGTFYTGFVDRLLKKVEYNRTRSYRHGKTF